MVKLLHKYVDWVQLKIPLPGLDGEVPSVKVNFISPYPNRDRTLLCHVSYIVTVKGRQQRPSKRLKTDLWHCAAARAIAATPIDGEWRILPHEGLTSKVGDGNKLIRLMRTGGWSKYVKVVVARIDGKWQIAYKRIVPEK